MIRSNKNETEKRPNRHGGQCDQIWRNFTTLEISKNIGNFERVYLAFGKILNASY